MRILHVTPYASAAWAYGGIPRVTAAFSRTLSQRGHEVTVCATDVSEADRRLHAGHPLLALLRGEHVTVPGPDGVTQRIFPNLSNRLAYHQQLFLPRGLTAYLRHHARDFDVAHLHACRNLPGVIASRVLRQARVPYVLSPNGTAPAIERKILAKRIVDAAVGRRMLSGAASVIAVTHAERKQLVALGVSADTIAVIPNPIDLEEFASPIGRGRFRKRLGLAGEPLVTFLGKQTPRKRVDVLARAFAQLRLPHVHLAIAGNTIGDTSSLRCLVRELGIEARTHFVGLLRGGERLELLADADVVVYPSDHEVFGLVPLEALLCGSPVIVADGDGCGEIIGSSGGGLVTPLGDTDALAAAITSVLAAPDRWRVAAAQAARRVRFLYGSDVVTDRLEELYQSVARGPRSTSVSQPASLRPIATGVAPSVSFVVPVRNGAAWIRETLTRILSQAQGERFEVIVVDDGSHDDSARIARDFEEKWPVQVIGGPGRGAAAAINAGIRAARSPIICQVDQDVWLQPQWLQTLMAAMSDPTMGAAQGYYETDPDGSIFARVMGLDLEHRYAGIEGTETTHVCTGNAAYRTEALQRVGLFDESLGYGYDNDMSYRLRRAGYRLAFCRSARSRHRWREGLIGYIVQQYGFGYGRLDLVAKHPSRITGDSVSRLRMMAHPLLMVMALMMLLGLPWLTTGAFRQIALGSGSALIVALGLERLTAGLQSIRRFGDLAALCFPLVHLVRDITWVVAIVVWLGRRIARQPARPRDSMIARTVGRVRPRSA